MREKKYAKVLEEYEEKLKKYRTIEEAEEELEESENEEKLSATRELKFKELQEAIDNEAADDAVDEDIADEDEVSNTAEVNLDTSEIDMSIEDELDEDPLEKINEISIDYDEEDEKDEKESSEKKKEVKEDKDDEIKIEKVSGKSDLDDLYLTTSFKPFRKRFKFSSFFVKLIVFLIILGGLFVLGYFVIYPALDKYVFNTPRRVFESTIDYIAETVSNDVSIYQDDMNTYSLGIKLDVDTDIKGLELLSEYDYNINMGMDFKRNIMAYDFYISKGDDIAGYEAYFENKHSYMKLLPSEQYMYLGEDKNEMGDWDFVQSLTYLQLLFGEDFKYAVNKEAEIYKELLDDNYLSKEKDEITIDGKTVKVNRNTFKLDQKVAIELEKKYYKLVREDKRLLEYLAALNDMTSSDYEDYIDNLTIDSNYDKDFAASYNIYTIKGNEVIGFDYEENGFRMIYYYRNGNEFEFYINLTEDTECISGGDCIDSNKMVIQLLGEEKDNETEVTIKYNNHNVGTIYIKESNDNKLYLEYEISYQGFSADGSLLLSKADTKETMEFKLNTTDYYINVKIDSESTVNANIKELKDYGYLEYSDKVAEEQLKAYLDQFDEIGFGDILEDLLSGLQTPVSKVETVNNDVDDKNLEETEDQSDDDILSDDEVEALMDEDLIV